MAIGQFSDENLALGAAFSEGAWVAQYPLTNLVADDYLGHPTRCDDPANLAKSKFQVALEWPRPVSLIGVLFHTLSIDARYRLTIADLNGSFAEPLLQTDWVQVVPAIYNSADLTWESPNWWTGQLLAEELDLYPRHLWIPLPAEPIVTAFRLELDDQDNTAGYFDLGGLWVASSWSPAFNFERGRQLSATARAQIDEAPSGRRFAEERRSRRQLAVEWRDLSEADAHRLFDGGMRAGVTKPVLFVPDLDNPLSLVREAFPATFQTPPAPTFAYEGLHSATATFQEIIA